MRTRVLVLACATAMSLATPCAAGWFHSGPPEHVAPDRVAAIRSVAVIPALNHELEVEEIGSTVFSNRKSYLAIGNWRLDDVAVQAVEATLSPRFKVVRSELPASDFREPEAQRPSDRDDQAQRAEQAKSLIVGQAPKEADAYLVIKTFNEYGGDNGSTSFSVYGLGIRKRDGLFIMSALTKHAHVQLLLIDARTAETLAVQPLCFPKAGEACSHWAWRGLDSADWADTADTLTPEQVATLERDFTAMLGEGVRGALEDMGLATAAAQP